jgi:hypothetical protein
LPDFRVIDYVSQAISNNQLNPNAQQTNSKAQSRKFRLNQTSRTFNQVQKLRWIQKLSRQENSNESKSSRFDSMWMTIAIASPSMQVQVLNRNREIKLPDLQYGAEPFREETALGEEMQ